MKYPNLKVIDDHPHALVSHDHAAKLRAGAKAVCSRINCRAWWDTGRHMIVFGYQHSDGVVDLFVPAVRFWRNPQRTVPSGWRTDVGDKWSVDSLVSTLSMAKASPERKQRWLDESRKAEKDADEKEKQALIDDAEKEAWKKTNFEYDKHSIGSRYKKTVAMS